MKISGNSGDAHNNGDLPDIFIHSRLKSFSLNGMCFAKKTVDLHTNKTTTFICNIY